MNVASFGWCQIFCLHGGLSPSIDTLDHARALDRIQEVHVKPNSFTDENTDRYLDFVSGLFYSCTCHSPAVCCNRMLLSRPEIYLNLCH